MPDRTDEVRRYLFFTGKGGVGKTSLATATAVRLADEGRSVLLVSTDPASNLDQVLGASFSSVPAPVPGVARLAAMNIDPEEAAREYRARALEPLRERATERELRDLEEQLSGACTVEIAAFDAFTRLLVPGLGGDAYDHIVFDTAPTGHTLRLLSLPAAWSMFATVNPRGASCLGPSSALTRQRSQYEAAVATLQDSTRTEVVLVARPERGALVESARTAEDLQSLGLHNQRLIVNGVFSTRHDSDPVAASLERRGGEALARLPDSLARLPRTLVPLRPFNVVGLEAIRALLATDQLADLPRFDGDFLTYLDLPPLAALVDDLERPGKGIVMVMGKGGVGKTTLAAAIAVELADRGHAVHLTTTDPAAHVARTIEHGVPNLTVSRIDPREETARYTERILSTRRHQLSDEEFALLEEDLRSPCTEEVAVFHAFSRMVSQGRSAFVVIDTAPTGHTLLLLDTTGAYHHEILRSLDQSQRQARAVTPLMRLRDPEFTRMVLVSLPEPTPIQEARQLQDDLRRAGIEPYAWVVNASLAAQPSADPILAARAREEHAQILSVEQDLAERLFLVPWKPEEPVGPNRLRDMTAPHQVIREPLTSGA